ncbi:PQQ-binding-like beta-propeller repeat protein [Methanobacterium spitsbergense]|uniref:PQQ-binding-like beta-propeller repeat protein n=1 Tax=Methanobacterium spitsbergense TaxID=2874285 RepID=A0A8T5V2M8_9EURY|nr:PQQ-binding-like beta-propeller repeat protein [Methanobacterium spitsbergense]MBZ2165925.1 PQQ-binding-like beta-propeller repeat protein [Methanobacterium spitsbergense]
MITKILKFKQFLFILVVVTLVIISFSPTMAASPNTLADNQYPKAMHDNQNTGQSQYTGPQHNNTKWNYTTGNIDSRITYAPSIGPDGTIYMPTRFNNGTNYMANLYALNKDGTKKWNYTINDGIYNENCYNQFVGSPTITADGTIYIINEFHDSTRTYGLLYALNPEGTMKWKYILNEGASVYISGSPAVATDGTIYFSSEFLASDYSSWNGNFYALKPDGTKKWNYTIGNYADSSPAIGSDGTIYFRSDDNNLFAINPDGTKKWNYLLPYGDIRGSPAVATDGTIYLSSNFNNDGILFALNPNGTLKWNYTIKEVTEVFLESSPSIAKDGTIYVGGYFRNGRSVTGNLYAFNPNGTFKWNFKTPLFISREAVIGADGTIYFGDGGAVGTFYALNPNGTKKWSLDVEPTTAGAIDSDGTLYFGIKNGTTDTLYAIQDPKADLYINSWASKANSTVGETIKLTFKVGNNGPNTAQNVVFTLPIPEGMEFVSANTDLGTFTYNPTTRIITWNLGDVVVGDPYLWANVRALNAGTYIFFPRLTTNTYDPTLNQNTQSITFNALNPVPINPINPVPVNPVNPVNPVPVNTAEAANIISMQDTGTPIVPLAIAVISILGGLAANRRK